MEDSPSIIVLIAPWSSPHLREERRLLRDLVEDLRREQISVLPLPPWPPFGEPPWVLMEWEHWLRRLDIEGWDYLLHRWWRYHHDWTHRYPEWRQEMHFMLRRLADRGEARAVVILAQLDEEMPFDSEALRDFVGVVKPAVVVYLRIGQADRHIPEEIPNTTVLNYPEERSKLLHLIRRFSGDAAAAQVEDISARHAMARHEFADRTEDQQRPKITVAYPEVIAPSCWSTVEIFLYLRDYRKLVQSEIQRLQDREDLDYSGMSSEFPKSLPTGCPVRVSLQSNSLRCNPSELTINWYEPYNRLPFRISPINDNKHGYSASLNVDVFADDLPVASMRLAVAVNLRRHGEHAIPATSDAAWYENIFASYAREDLEIVKHLKERYEALGLYMFIDLDDLRSGASWRTKAEDSSDQFTGVTQFHQSRRS
jgi:hypothetical protein